MNIIANPDFHIYYLSERAVTIEFGNRIGDDLLSLINSFDAHLHQNRFIGFITTVPAYATLTVFYDPVAVSLSADLIGETSFDKVSQYLTELNSKDRKPIQVVENIITIPVCYGLHFGPDMKELSGLHGLSVPDIINLHSDVIYRVYMIGFVPGFAYLGGMNKLLYAPRKANPRKAVPAGAVGIAGGQTGIYPLETPGGWQIIGQTPTKLFDVERAQPSLLKTGDQVVFKPISPEEYHQLSARQ